MEFRGVRGRITRKSDRPPVSFRSLYFDSVRLPVIRVKVLRFCQLVHRLNEWAQSQVLASIHVTRGVAVSVMLPACDAAHHTIQTMMMGPSPIPVLRVFLVSIHEQRQAMHILPPPRGVRGRPPAAPDRLARAGQSSPLTR